MNAAKTHKQTALDFLHMIVAGNIHEAYQRHVSPVFQHHNPYFKGDAASLEAGMQESEKMHPDKIFEVQRALEDGDLVAVHSRIRMYPTDRGGSVVHLFRFEGDKIAELWDVFHLQPEEMVNENGMF